MNILLFLIIIVVSFIAVRIGAIAFELTGMEWSLAKFQALSCFTGTGFTTKESELVVGNPQRRRIASVIMVLGNAGLVTMIATFANSLRPTYLPQVKVPFLDLFFPSWLLPWINLTVIIVSLYIIYKTFTQSNLTKKITKILKEKLIKRDVINPVSFEELLVATGGYGVSSIELCKNSPLLNKQIRNANLRQYDITILVVERRNEVIPNPSAETKLILGDRLVCFGKLETIRSQLCLV